MLSLLGDPCVDQTGLCCLQAQGLPLWSSMVGIPGDFCKIEFVYAKGDRRRESFLIAYRPQVLYW